MKTMYKYFKGPYFYGSLCIDPCPTKKQEIKIRESYNPGTLILFTDRDLTDIERLSLEEYLKEYDQLEDKLKNLNIYRIHEVRENKIPEILKERGL